MKISIVSSLYQSESYIDQFYTRTIQAIKQIDVDYEFVFVDDGSPDHSKETVLRLISIDSNVKLVELSRNFGHHIAMKTGIAHCSGETIFLIDCDLEEPPECLVPFYQELMTNDDIDVVYGRQESRKGKKTERVLGSWFYRLINKLSEHKYESDTLTARVMSKRYADGLLQLKDQEYDLWIQFARTGFEQKSIPVIKESRGNTTYTFWKKMNIATTAITNSSTKPLIAIFFLGLAIFLVSFLSFLGVEFYNLSTSRQLFGRFEIMLSIWTLGGIIILCAGIIAVYLSKIFKELKSDSKAIVKHVHKSSQTN
ncbi:MAG: putative glycosyltransferase [Parvicellaceae bacterium]|jgi:putative glycosyltransferase